MSFCEFCKISKNTFCTEHLRTDEVTMGWLLIVESRLNTFSATCLLFWTCFAWQKHAEQTFQEQWFKLSGLMQYSPWVLKDLIVSVVITLLYILYLALPHNLQQPFFFSRVATFALTRNTSKLLALLNPVIETFLKNFPCSLSGVNNKYISNSLENTWW